MGLKLAMTLLDNSFQSFQITSASSMSIILFIYLVFTRNIEPY